MTFFKRKSHGTVAHQNRPGGGNFFTPHPRCPRPVSSLRVERSSAAALVLVATMTVAGGCSSAPSSESSPSTSSNSSSPTVSSSASGPNDEEMTDSPEAEASPTWDASERKGALRAAKEVMAAYANTNTPQAQWWRDLAPLMTPAARKVYNTVDVTIVPVSTVRDGGTITESSSPYLARVEFKTDAGVYTVLIARTGPDAPWLAERIEPGRSR